MIEKKNTGRFFGAFLGIVFATFVTVAIRQFLPGFSQAALQGIFAIFWIGFYFLGIWMIVERPPELNRKFPLSGKELRRRKKEFYDWLNSQPPR